MTEPRQVSSPPQSPPLAVQVGFAGSRQLFDRDHPRINPGQFEEAVAGELGRCLAQLPAELGLSPQHFLCGISQAAIGGDVAFIRACAAQGVPQRIFLPQLREDFLTATSESGVPDFTPDQANAVRDLLSGEHIIEEQVVSHSPIRHERFEEVNLEIVRQSDVLVCLLRENAEHKAGGSNDLILRAENRNKPVLEIRVSAGDDGQPAFSSHWRQREKFRLPQLPEELDQLKAPLPRIPPIADYCQALKSFASHRATGKQTLFKAAALIIIVTHVAATMCALAALLMHSEHLSPYLPRVLMAELGLLAIGFLVHQNLHRSHAARVWGMARLAAEIGRSVQAMGGVPCDLAHLFHSPLPDTLSPLVRTLNILHLRDVRGNRADWRESRAKYVERRLTNKKSGQVSYYTRRRRRAACQLALAHYGFITASSLAMAATLAKLLMHTEKIHVAEPLHEQWMHILGGLAIILPVVAVAGLSLAASFDLEARSHTYSEMLHFLTEQQRLLENCTSQREFAALVMETESHLVGETAVWYARRAFIGVA